MPPCTVVIFAKAPVPGFAKTRLVPALGVNGAARLAARLLAEMVAQALAANVGPVHLCCAPDAAHTAFAGFAGQRGLTLSDQGGGHLGDRMHRALQPHLGAGARAMLVGTDIPALDADYLRLADAALRTTDAVLAPAADGGYALIGLHQAPIRLFQDVAWSTAEVMATTRLRLRECGLLHVELPTVCDVDEPHDLVHLPKGWL